MNPQYILMGLDRKKIIRVSDKFYVRCLYREEFDKKLNLKNPQTFNEKLQWLKLYDRNPKYTKMVDKYEVKEYVTKIIGKEYVIPTLGVYDNFDEINFDKLPNQFVIKCTHDSGGLVICEDKTKLNIEETKNKINECLNKNFYYAFREWPYKNVKPRIIVEEYMKDDDTTTLRDYKFYCFNGEPLYLYISEGLIDHSTARISFFDMDFKVAPFGRSDYAEFDKIPKKPQQFEKMIEISRILSKEIPFLRVDLYEINGKVYFSELTFFPCAGFMPFNPKEWDRKLGDMLNLPKKENEEKYEK